MPDATSDAAGLYSYAGGYSFQLPASPVREIGYLSQAQAWLLRPNGHVDFMRQTRPGADENPKSIETGKGTIALVRTPTEGGRVLLLKHDAGTATAEVWDFKSAKKLMTATDQKITDCAISGDGATVAIEIADGPKSKIERWSLEPWRIAGASECMAVMGDWKPVGKTTGSSDLSAMQDIACAWFNSQYGLKTGESAAMERQAFGTNADVRLNRGNSDPTTPPKDDSGTDAPSDNSRDQGDKSAAAKSGDTNTQQQGSKSGELLHAASYRVTYTCDSCGYTWTAIHSLPYSGEQGVVCPKCNKQGAKASSEKLGN